MFGIRTTIVTVLLLVTAPAFGQQMSRDEIVSVQIILDDAGFSPGQIDGKWGGQTQIALSAWQQAHDLKPTGEFDTDTAANFPAGNPDYTNHVVTADELGKLVHVT